MAQLRPVGEEEGLLAIPHLRECLRSSEARLVWPMWRAATLHPLASYLHTVQCTRSRWGGGGGRRGHSEIGGGGCGWCE